MNQFPYPIMIQKKEDQMEIKEPNKHNDIFKYATAVIAFVSAFLLAEKGYQEFKKIASIIVLFIMGFCLFASFFIMSLLSK